MMGAGIMAMVMAVESRKGKKLQDKVFSVGRAAQEAIDLYGEEQVVNATVGCYGDESGTLGCLPLVEKIYRQLPIHDFIAYAPPLGLDAYRQMVIEEVFEAHRPDAYCDAIATAGGTGAIHIAIMNYSEIGDAVLVTDWHWGVYGSLCQEVERKLQTFSLFDAKGAFNIVAFTAGVDSLLEKQDSLLIILNTPAHNPTGYSLSYEEWQQVLEVCQQAEKKGKKISIVVDIAYIAYAGEKNEVRYFMELFSHLPEHLFIMVAFSMSKGYTLYGQRTGALVGISSSRAVIDEFIELGKYSARTAWSNVNRAAMTLLTTVRHARSRAMSVGDYSLSSRLFYFCTNGTGRCDLSTVATEMYFYFTRNRRNTIRCLFYSRTQNERVSKNHARNNRRNLIKKRVIYITRFFIRNYHYHSTGDEHHRLVE